MMPGEATDPMSMSGPMRPGCDGMDRNAVNLCVEQCNFGSQNAGSGRTPAVPAPIVAVLYFLPAKPQPVPRSAGPRRHSVPTLAASPPPHSILHCVFLI
jgi:hypothetical protein